MARVLGALFLLQSCVLAGPQFVTSPYLPAAQVGSNYSLQLVVAGGTPGASGTYWSQLAGRLPDGLLFDMYTGQIHGVPSVAGDFALAIQFSNGFDPVIVGYFSLSVAGALKATVAPPKVSAVGLTEQGLGVDGGVPPYLFTIQSGQLPPGLQLTAGGIWLGQHTAAGTYSYTVLITDGVGNRLSLPVNQVVEQSPLTILTVTTPMLRSGVPVRFPIEVTGGTPPYTVSPMWGETELPCGLTLDVHSGVITGTLCAGSGWYYLQTDLVITDSLGLSQRTQLQLVNSDGFNPRVNVTEPAILIKNQSLFWAFLPIPAGPPPLQWSAKLPDGLQLESDVGAIHGILNEAGSFPITVTVSDGTGAQQTTQYTLEAAPNPVQILTSSLPAAVVGGAYSVLLQGNGPGQWGLIPSNDLPPSINLFPDGTLKCTFDASVFPPDYTLLAALSTSKGQATRSLTLSIAPASGSGERNYTVSPYGLVGQPFRQRLGAISGKLPDTFHLVGQPLPDGITLDSSGLLHGVPLQAGYFQFLVSILSADGVAGTATVNMTVSDLPIASSQGGRFCPPDAWVGVPYSVVFEPSAYPGTGAVSVAAGTLPPGLSLDSSTGILQGIPGAIGEFQFLLNDVLHGTAQMQSCQMVVGPNPSIQALTLPPASAGAEYSATLPTASNQPVTWNIGPGTLPSGLKLNPATGELTGSIANAGAYVFDAIATGSGPPATTAFLLNVTSPSGLTISPAQLPAFNRTQYSPILLSVSGGTPPYLFDVTGGSLSGLVLDPVKGTLSGSPSQNGSVTLRATDSQGRKASITYQLVVSGPPLVLSVPGTLPPATATAPYSFQASAAGGIPPIIWRLTVDGELYTSYLSISSSGLISGVVIRPGTRSLGIFATDALGQVASANVTLPVNDFASGVLSIPPQTLPKAGNNFAYQAALLVNGGVAPYQWSISSGVLPPGISLGPWGVVYGTPKASGAFSITVQVTDSTGASAVQALSIEVDGSVPKIGDGGVVNAASYQGGAIAPGEIVDIFGAGLGPATIVYSVVSFGGFGTQAGQTQVFFDGIPVPVIFASDRQVAAVAPFHLAGRSSTVVTVSSAGVISAPVTVAVKDFAPGIFTADASGAGTGAIINQDGSRNGPEHPAPRGSIVTLFATGTGAMTADLADGQLAPLQPPFAAPAFQATVLIGQAGADIVYQGVAPGEIAGLTQMNVIIPKDSAHGALPVTVRQSYPGFPSGYEVGIYTSSPNGVIVYVE